MAVPFTFNERKHEVYYHNVRIYIAGADVTPWLTGSISRKMVGLGGTSTLGFTLSNTYQAFEMTEQNLNPQNGKAQFRLYDPRSAEGAYSELAKAKIYGLKNKDSVNLKHAVKSFGSAVMAKSNNILRDSTAFNADQSFDSTVSRFAFNVGSLVLHKYDPVRMFIANPFSKTDNEWVCIFTGYVDTKPYSQDYVNGQPILNVTCQDIRVLMQNMRTQINSFAQYSNEQALLAFGNKPASNTIDAGFFNDLNVPGRQQSHVLGARTWLGSIEFLIFGNSGTRTYGAIGGLSKGETKRYSPSDSNKTATLEDWNNLLLFGTTRTWMTKQQMQQLGETTFPGLAGSPDATKVHFLLPAEGTPNHNLITYNVDTSIAVRVEWASRLDLINRLCKDIDYQFYVTGIGDLVFEFPMYDFLPPNFGTVYNQILTFDKHKLSDSINDEGGTPITALEINSVRLQEWAQGPESNPIPNNVDVWSTKRVIYSNVLASRFGVQVESMTVPGVVNRERLAQIGAIEFNKRISNFDSMDLITSYRPMMLVNRPILHITKKRMGILTNFTETYMIREGAQLTLELQYIRKQQADGSWKFITGGEAAPISYAKLYSGKTIVPDQGVGLDGPDVGNPVSTPLDGAN